MYAIRSYYESQHFALRREHLLLGQQDIRFLARLTSREGLTTRKFEYLFLRPGPRIPHLYIHQEPIQLRLGQGIRITSYNVCYTKLLRSRAV